MTGEENHGSRRRWRGKALQNIVSMIHIVRICRVFHEAGVLNLIDDQQPGKIS
jgi:sulfur relay (sulfurtransferase) DsrF/TusC family protein